MSLIASIQNILLDMELPSGESMEDVVVDCQEYALETIVDEVTELLSPEDIMKLDEMIANGKSVDEIDQWLSTKVSNYDEYREKALDMVKDYLSEDVDVPVE